MRPPAQQLGALLLLRWNMIRSSSQRVAVVAAFFVLGWLLQLAVLGAGRLDGPTLATAVDLAPAAYLGFGALAFIAPLTAGGGQQVVPANQLIVFPVRPRAIFLGGLLLAPLNMVWIIQLLVLATLAACLTVDGSLLGGGLTTISYVVCLTVAGQALAWWVGGLTHTEKGRRLIGSAAVIGLLALVLVVHNDLADDALALSPTHAVVRAVAGGDLSSWAVTTSLLVALTAVGLWAGSRLCAHTLRRPDGSRSGRGAAHVRRRRERHSQLRQLVAVDRASVWRAPALRRGGLVLAVLPGLAAAGAGVPWESMIVLPGLVAAGTGLLFGINAFSLDGSGAVWLASLPHDPARVARAKAIVLSETVLAAVVLATVAGSLRSPGSPTPTEVSAIIASGLACSALVIAQCMRASVRRPHRAELQGPRDAVAPPGALALASARLALPTGLIGLWIAAAAGTGVWWLPVAFALPVVLGAGLSLSRTLRRYSDPVVRARVVHVVAAG